MKKSTLLKYCIGIILSFSFFKSFSQMGCAWAKGAGGANQDLGTAVVTDAMNNSYYLGNFYSSSIQVGTTILQNEPYIHLNFGSEMFLAKYDSCGNFIWAKRAGGNSNTNGNGIAIDGSGNIYVTGSFSADTLNFGAVKLYGNSTVDAFLVKYDMNGNALWAKKGTGTDVDQANAVSTDPTGNVYITGSFVSPYFRIGTDSIPNTTATFYKDVFIAKFDMSGNIQWIGHGRGNADESGYGISNDAAGNVYVTGFYSSTYIRFANDSLPLFGYNDIFIVKYNTAGVEQWLRTAGASDNDQGNAIATDAAGNSYITGIIGYNSTVSFGSHTVTNPNSSWIMFLAKYDPTGTALWARVGLSVGFTDNPGYNISLDGGGNPVVIGYYTSDSLKFGPLTLYNKSLAMGGGDTISDVFVTRYKSNGNVSWARSFGGASNDYGFGIHCGARNSTVICGQFDSPSMTLPGGVLTSSTTAGDAFIANNVSTSSINPALCLVTTDSTSTNNIVYWDKSQYSTVDTFLVLREVTTGVYKQIAKQPYSSLSQFIDTSRHVIPANGDPNIGTYRYKIQTLDTSGCYGQLGPYHNTIFFTNNGSGTFNWNLYTVENMTITPVTQFNLLRDDNNTGAWHVIGTVAGTQTTLNDASYSTYSLTANWRVEALGFSCTPTMRLGNNSVENAIIKSKSNISNNRGVGVSSFAHNNFVVAYPNPVSDMITLSASMPLGKITVMNNLGQVVYSEQTQLKEKQLDLSMLPPGIYSISVLNGYSKIVKL